MSEVVHAGHAPNADGNTAVHAGATPVSIPVATAAPEVRVHNEATAIAAAPGTEHKPESHKSGHAAPGTHATEGHKELKHHEKGYDKGHKPDHAAAPGVPADTHAAHKEILGKVTATHEAVEKLHGGMKEMMTVAESKSGAAAHTGPVTVVCEGGEAKTHPLAAAHGPSAHPIVPSAHAHVASATPCKGTGTCLAQGA